MGYLFICIDYNIEFRGTIKHANADSLSRLPLAEDDDADTVASIFTVSLNGGLPITASDNAAATAKDLILMRVYRYALEGCSVVLVRHLCFSY